MSFCYLLLIYKCYLYKVRHQQNLHFLAFEIHFIKIRTLEKEPMKKENSKKSGRLLILL